MSKRNTSNKNKKRDLHVKLEGSGQIPNVGSAAGKASVKYTRAPIASGMKMTTRQPSINGGKGYVVKHSEYLMNVSVAAGFSVAIVPIQPGLDLAFPWLSNIASNYESYRIRSLQYRYEPQCATTQPGTFFMAIDYDAADTAAINKSELLAKAGAVRCALWDRACCRYNPSSRAYPKMFVRSGALQSGLDIKTYDAGKLNVGLEGDSANLVGELYVDYEIEFLTPEQNQNDEIEAGSYSTAFTTGTSTAPFLGGPLSPLGELPITFPTQNKFSISRVGTYLLIGRVNGTNMVANVNPIYTAVVGNDVRSSVSSFCPTGAIAGNPPGSCVFVSEIKIFTPGDTFIVNLSPLFSSGSYTGMVWTIAPFRVISSDPAPVQVGKFIVVKPTEEQPSRTDLDWEEIMLRYRDGVRYSRDCSAPHFNVPGSETEDVNHAWSSRTLRTWKIQSEH